MKWVIALVCVAGIVRAPAQERDSLERSVSDTGAFVMHKSPLTATLLSAVVPGAGQFYNEDYFKIPVIWGIGGFLAYEVVRNNNEFLRYQDLYFNSPDSTVRGNQQYFALKEGARDDRDYYGAFLFLVYVLNVLDAYVGAHLFDFPLGGSSHISRIHVAPTLFPSRAIGLNLRIGFR